MMMMIQPLSDILDNTFLKSPQILMQINLHMCKSFLSLMLETGLNLIETGENNDCPSLKLRAKGKLMEIVFSFKMLNALCWNCF